MDRNLHVLGMTGAGLEVLAPLGGLPSASWRRRPAHGASRPPVPGSRRCHRRRPSCHQVLRVGRPENSKRNRFLPRASAPRPAAAGTTCARLNRGASRPCPRRRSRRTRRPYRRRHPRCPVRLRSTSCCLHILAVGGAREIQPGSSLSGSQSIGRSRPFDVRLSRNVRLSG
jgi:hypothetical protein